MNPAVYPAASRENKQNDVPPHNVADPDEEQRRAGQLGSKPGVDLRKLRHDLDQKERRDRNGNDDHDDWIHHRRFHLLAQPCGILQINCQTSKNLGKQTALFTRGNHREIKPVEHLRVLLQRLGETVPAFHSRAHVPDHVAHRLVGRLFRQGLERLHHRQTGIDHRCQLPRENDQIAQSHTSATGPTLFAHLLLDRDDQEIAVEQRGNRRLLSSSFHRAAYLPPGGGFPCDINK